MYGGSQFKNLSFLCDPVRREVLICWITSPPDMLLLPVAPLQGPGTFWSKHIFPLSGNFWPHWTLKIIANIIPRCDFWDAFIYFSDALFNKMTSDKPVENEGNPGDGEGGKGSKLPKNSSSPHSQDYQWEFPLPIRRSPLIACCPPPIPPPRPPPRRTCCVKRCSTNPDYCHPSHPLCRPISCRCLQWC